MRRRPGKQNKRSAGVTEYWEAESHRSNPPTLQFKTEHEHIEILAGGRAGLREF
jgi:hypothetical protein